MSSLEVFFNLAMGIVKVARFPLIFPARLAVAEYPILGAIKNVFETSFSPRETSSTNPETVNFVEIKEGVSGLSLIQDLR
jgi:hypothetical protein